jgi:hypothetical protein
MMNSHKRQRSSAFNKLYFTSKPVGAVFISAKRRENTRSQEIKKPKREYKK